MSKLSWLSVMLLGCCLAIGCGEGESETAGDTAIPSSESLTNDMMEAGSGVGGGAATE